MQSTKALHFLLKHAGNHKSRDPTTSTYNQHNFRASFHGFASVKDTSQVKAQLQKPPIHLILSSQEALHEFQAQPLVSAPQTLPQTQA